MLFISHITFPPHIHLDNTRVGVKVTALALIRSLGPATCNAALAINISLARLLRFLFLSFFPSTLSCAQYGGRKVSLAFFSLDNVI